MRHRTLWLTLLGIALVLLAARAALPAAVLHYVNRELERLGPYTGHIDDIDLELWRGGYRIEAIRIDKRDGGVPVPFFAAERIELSLDWRALRHAGIAGRIVLVHPVWNLVDALQERDQQFGRGVDWRARLQRSYPFRFDSFSIEDGEMHLRNFSSEPPVDVYLTGMQASGRNLANVREHAESAFAEVEATADAMGDSRLDVSLRVDPWARRPTFDLDLTLEQVELVRLANLFDAYANVDPEAGTFALDLEIAASDGRLEGYAKPVLENAEFLDLEHGRENPLKLAWEAIVASVAQMLGRGPENEIATRIPLGGRIEDPDADVWGAIGGLLRNAFAQAIERGADDTVELPE